MKHLKKLLATVLCIMLVLSALPMWVWAEEYPGITLDTTFSVSYDDEWVYYTFTPEETGIYNVASDTEVFDTQVQIYKELSEKPIAEDDDDGESLNFNLDCFLLKGSTYYFGFMSYTSDATFDVILSFAGEFSAAQIGVGETKDVNIETENEKIYFSFTPEEDGYYSFYSSGDYDTYGVLYDENLIEITSNDDGEDTNFYIAAKLTGGATYFFSAEMLYSDVLGSFAVTLEKTKMPTEIIIDSEDEIDAFSGKLLELGYSVLPADSVREIEAVSSDESVAYVYSVYSESVELAFVDEGTADITFSTVNGLEKKITVNVTDIPAVAINEATPVKLQENKYNGVYHFTFTPEESGSYIYANKESVLHYVYIHDSEGNRVSEAYASGMSLELELEAGKEYHFRICTFNESDEFEIAIAKSSYPEKIEIEGGDRTVYVDGSGDLDAYRVPFYSEYVDIYFESSDPNILSVDSDGRFNAYEEGEVTVTATTGDLSDSITVTVIEGYPIYLNKTETVTITENDEYKKFIFVPENSGKYSFTSYGEEIVRGVLYDQYGDIIEEYYGDSYENNFSFRANLDGGEKYYLEVALEEKPTGEFTVAVTEAPVPVKAEISNMPYKTEYFVDTLYESFDFAGVEFEVTYSDGSVVYTEFYDWEFEYKLEYYEDGESGTVTVSFEGLSVEIPVKLVASPIESIEIDPDFSFTFMENVGGYPIFDYNDVMFFYYDYLFPTDLPITVNFKNGEEKEVTVNDMICGEYFWLDDDQYNEHWESGGEYFVTLAILDAEVNIPVTIEENTITSVELTAAPDKKEYVFGDVNFGFYTGSEYLVCPVLDGIEFTVNYSDRESKVLSYDEETGCIGGYYIDYPQCVITKPGTQTAELEFMGESYTFDIVVTESKVKAIEVVKLPDITKYTYYANYFNPIGMEIKITYTDNTSEIVEVTEEKLDYIGYYWEEGLIIENGDNDIVICVPYYNEEIEIICGGVSIVFDGVTVIEEDIVDLKILDMGNNGDGMVAEITFADGNTDTITLNVIYSQDYAVSSYGYAVTDYGVVWYRIFNNFDVNGNVLFSEVELLNFDIIMLTVSGDVNGDGKVNTVDLASLKLFLAGGEEINKNGADINGDGNVNTVDLAELKLTLAGA